MAETTNYLRWFKSNSQNCSMIFCTRPYERRLVFAAFAGEPWDYMGSKRFLWELESGSAATAGLSLQSINQVPLSGPR